MSARRYLALVLSLLLLGISCMGVDSANAQDPIKILAWTGEGSYPGLHSLESPGQLVFIDGQGTMETIFDMPQGTTRVQPCSEQATSPNGDFFTFYVGEDNGSLYFVDDTDTLTHFDGGVRALTCLGMGTFQYSPDSNRFGYIDFVSDAVSSTYANGWLYVWDTADLAQNGDEAEPAISFNNDRVVAFDLSDDYLAFVSFYTDPNDRANEAAIYFMEGDGVANEVSTLYAEEGCFFRSAQVAIINSDLMSLIVGQRCSAGTEWVLYMVDTVNRTNNRTFVDGDVTGDYYAVARSNVMVASPDTGTVYFTYPDGFVENTTNVQPVILSDIQPTEPLFNNAQMPHFSESGVYPRSISSYPVLSPDGAWLALVTDLVTGDYVKDAKLHVIELNAPELPPITSELHNNNHKDTFAVIAFTPDSRKVLYVGGGNNVQPNSLFMIDLASAAESRIARGRFGTQLLVAPDGGSAAVIDWQILNSIDQPAYQNLIVIDLESRETHTVFTGAEVVDEIVIEQHFIYPLSWR